MRKKDKLVHGWGINDSDGYVIRSERINGKRKQVWRCPYYDRWYKMVTRCYSPKLQTKFQTYKGCSVCDEWKYFSNFKKWMMTQDWEGKDLDKDFLVKGNKKYSPETCVFMHHRVNSFVTDSGVARGECLIGASWKTQSGKFVARCKNPFTSKEEHLGYFTCETEAHLAWKKHKHEMSCQLADSEYVTDERVRIALRNWYK